MTTRPLAALICAATASAVLAAPASAQQVPAALDWRANACSTAYVPQGTFADTADNFFASAVDCLRHFEITLGAADGGYRPSDTVTRAQMASFLHRTGTLLGVPDWDERPSAFTDIAALPETQQSEIAALAAAGIARGTSATTFSPEQPVTRGQMAAFLQRLQSWVVMRPLRPFPGERRFDDVGPTFAADAEALAFAGVAAGTGDRAFSPDRPVSRDQMAGFLARLLELNVRESVWAPPFPATNDLWTVRPEGTLGPIEVSEDLGEQTDQVTITFSGLPAATDYRVTALDVRGVRRQADGSAQVQQSFSAPGTASLPGGPTPTGGELDVLVNGAGEGRAVAVLWRDLDDDFAIDPDEPSTVGPVVSFVRPEQEPGAYDKRDQFEGRFFVYGTTRRVDMGAVLQADPRTDRFVDNGVDVGALAWFDAAPFADEVTADYRTGPGGSSVFRLQRACFTFTCEGIPQG